MRTPTADRARRFYAETYDATGITWPGELPFYLALTTPQEHQKTVLELACGTGRIAIPLAASGVRITGLDRSPHMLDVARRKSEGREHPHWVEGDMRNFELQRSFHVILIPGHAFQNLITPEEQMACLHAIGKHLERDGTLVIHLDHLDPQWLADIAGEKAGVLQIGDEYVHPSTGQTIRTLYTWSYDRSTQTATRETIWDVASAREKVEERIESGPRRFHCFFPSEMEHLLNRCSFQVVDVYGDFHRSAFRHDSPEMIWLARPAG